MPPYGMYMYMYTYLLQPKNTQIDSVWVYCTYLLDSPSLLLFKCRQGKKEDKGTEDQVLRAEVYNINVLCVWLFFILVIGEREKRRNEKKKTLKLTEKLLEERSYFNLDLFSPDPFNSYSYSYNVRSQSLLYISLSDSVQLLLTLQCVSCLYNLTSSPIKGKVQREHKTYFLFLP